MPADVTAFPTVITPQDFHRFDPTRKPDSRYRRVLELIEHRPRPLRCKKWDDEFVRNMRTFMLGLRRGNERKRKLLAVQFPGQAAALEIYERTDSELRLDLECRILAGQGDAEIADRLGLIRETVATCEQLFFTVRDRLTCLDWVHSVVLDSNRRRGLPQFERWMKSQAFAAGPAGVDWLLSGDPTRRDQYRRIGEMADKFHKALDGEYTATQKAELARFIEAEQQAESAAAATRNAIVAAARQTLVAVEHRERDRRPEQPVQDAESGCVRSVA